MFYSYLASVKLLEGRGCLSTPIFSVPREVPSPGRHLWYRSKEWPGGLMLCWWRCQLFSECFLSQETYLCHPGILGSVLREMKSHEKVLSKGWMWDVNRSTLWKYLQVEVVGCIVCVRGWLGFGSTHRIRWEMMDSHSAEGTWDWMVRCSLVSNPSWLSEAWNPEFFHWHINLICVLPDTAHLFHLKGPAF